MSKPLYRALYESLNAQGLLDYGSFIDAAMVQDALGIKVPAIGTRAVFEQAALEELSAVDYVRNALLAQGKYLAGAKGGYRVLLPSENAKQIEAYIQSADRKLNRALKLSRNSPKAANIHADQTEARIMMKRQGFNQREQRPSA